MGIRVEVMAFRYISRDLLHEADQYVSGYLIPNLLPVAEQRNEDWGAIGTRARGYCYSVQDGYGFMKYLDIDMATWRDIFFHFSQLPERHYVNLDDVFEFYYRRIASFRRRYPRYAYGIDAFKVLCAG
jgi:hypothetical protein